MAHITMICQFCGYREEADLRDVEQYEYANGWPDRADMLWECVRCDNQYMVRYDPAYDGTY